MVCIDIRSHLDPDDPFSRMCTTAQRTGTQEYQEGDSPSGRGARRGGMGTGEAGQALRGRVLPLRSLALSVAALALCALAMLAFLAGRPSAPAALVGGVAVGKHLHIDVPAQQLASTRVGDIVQGKMLASAAQGGGYIDWTGSITADTTVSPQQGSVTVRVISDKYIPPGTPVSGKVGAAGFMGTVVGAPNSQERVGNIERRLAALEPRAKGEVKALKKKLARMNRQLTRLEGKKTISERLVDLEKRLVELERRPPSKHGLTFAGNIAGLHFVGTLGSRSLADRIDRIDARITAIQSRPKPVEFAKPLEKKLDELEERMAELGSPGGKFAAKQEMAEMEARLKKLERMYGGGGGENSKWYGTAAYHGLYQPPVRTLEKDYPGGVFRRRS